MTRPVFLTSILAIFLTSACNGPKQKQQSSLALITQETHWVGMNANGSLTVRLTTADATCPTLTVDGSIIPTQQRGTTSAKFPTRVCEKELSATTQSIFLGNEKLPVLQRELNKIVIIGDTGCRIAQKSGGYKIQNCLNIKDWPLAAASESAAKLKPDLVIHVGDYHYREAPCPPENKECAGATSGDNWASWDEDFFAPAMPLLNAAPWIFARGNHELCDRAGIGWFQLLDPRAFQPGCTDDTPPYSVHISDHVFHVIDAATAENIQPSLNLLTPNAGAKNWVVLHRPFLTVGADDESSLRISIPKAIEQLIQVVIVGHQHRFTIQKFNDGRPPEIISGNGGTQLQKKPSTMEEGKSIFSSEKFGFLTAERIAERSWRRAICGWKSNRRVYLARELRIGCGYYLQLATSLILQSNTWHPAVVLRSADRTNRLSADRDAIVVSCKT